jgi:hypothetical protein
MAQNTNLNVNIDNNSITNLNSNGIEIFTLTSWTAGQVLNTNIRNNTLGTMAQPVGQGGVAYTNSALILRNFGAGTINAFVQDTAPANSLVSTLSSGATTQGTVYVTNEGLGGTTNATIQGLTLTNTGGNQNTFYGSNINTGTMCLDIENTTANAGAGEFDIRQTAGTLNLRFVGNNPAAPVTTGVIGAAAGCTLPVVMSVPLYVQTPPTFGMDINVAKNDASSFPANVLDTILNLGVSVAYAQGPATITIPFGTIPVNSTVTATFDVVVGGNIADGIDYLTLQGMISRNGFASFLSNDPDTEQDNDPTNTPLDPLRNVRELPSTGETPWWRSWLMLLIGLVGVSVIVGLRRWFR